MAKAKALDIKKWLVAGAAGALAWLCIHKKKSVDGIGALHGVIEGRVLDYKYRNTSLYGNNSYHVILEQPGGYIVWAYTAPNSQLGYTISNMVGKVVAFDYTRKKNGDLVLNETTADYDFKGDKK